VPLVNAILDMELLGAIIFGAMFLGLLLAFILIIYMTIATPFLSKRLDSIIFNAEWFTDFELGFYSTWPFSMMKTLYYMYFISFPIFSRRKRFKNVPQLNVPLSIIITSKFYIFLHLLTLFICLISIFVGAYVYFFYDSPPS